MTPEVPQIVKERINSFLRYKERVNLKINIPTGTFGETSRYYMKITNDYNKQCDNAECKMNPGDVIILFRVIENMHIDDYESIYLTFFEMRYHTDDI